MQQYSEANDSELEEGDEVAKENIGGRQTFTLNTKVRYIEISGRISKDVYLISHGSSDEKGQSVRSDRKGHITLAREDGSRQIKVHFRRILPLDMDGKAPVIQSGDKFRVICPTCEFTTEVNTQEDKFDCPTCGQFQLYWIGEKPMTEVKEKATKPKAEKAEKPAKPAKPAAKQPIVNFDELKKMQGCELWTKENVKFDHVGINVRAHALLCVEGEPRKLCFNTYDGALGKKAGDLPVEAFIKDEAVDGKKAWFAVKDLDKARAKLTKDGYVKI